MNVHSVKRNLSAFKRYGTHCISFLMALTLAWMVYEDFFVDRRTEELVRLDNGTDGLQSTASDFPTGESYEDDDYSWVTETTQAVLQLVDLNLEKERRDMEREAQLTGQRVPWVTENPLRILLVTTWRSGSTFLGRILSNHSATFNWYEPLIHFEHQINDGPNAEEAVEQLRSLLRCRFPPEYVNFVRMHTFDMLSHNAGIWDFCQIVDPSLRTCRSLAFLESSCSRFPVQVMKLVRFRVRLTEQFLSDPTLPGLKVIYLVRDPRAVMSSRWQLDWCRKLDDCRNPQKLCGFMDDDLESFKRLSAKYADRVMMIKYEDMAVNPVEEIRKVFRFSGLQFTERLEDIVRERTSKDDPQVPWGTVKYARNRVHLWKKTLSQNDTTLIENACSAVMSKLGYFSIYSHNETVKASHDSR